MADKAEFRIVAGTPRDPAFRRDQVLRVITPVDLPTPGGMSAGCSACESYCEDNGTSHVCRASIAFSSARERNPG
ncbi:hypothetical protein ACIQMJ_12105 [Actinosynnema sp. NPDC091369]